MAGYCDRESAVKSGSANRHKHELVDFVLPDLDVVDTADIYELIVERHWTAAAIVTSNRTLIEWLRLVADPLLAHSGSTARRVPNAEVHTPRRTGTTDRRRPSRIDAANAGARFRADRRAQL